MLLKKIGYPLYLAANYRDKTSKIFSYEIQSDKSFFTIRWEGDSYIYRSLNPETAFSSLQFDNINRLKTYLCGIRRYNGENLKKDEVLMYVAKDYDVVRLYEARPNKLSRGWVKLTGTGFAELPYSFFPELKNGDCVKVILHLCR